MDLHSHGALKGSEIKASRESKSRVAEKGTSQNAEKRETSPQLVVKSADAKKAVVEQDLPTMEAYGLVYDYANLNLQQVVQAYLDEMGVPHESIAFSYKNPKTGELIEMNETQPMRAGSTYKLPLNMLVVDEVEKGKFTLTERFDITNTYYEYQGEHDNYVNAFGGAMTIPDMQMYSLLYSENTPAYALADRLGGIEKARTMFRRYGQSKGEIKTFSEENYTTTNYYIQVLDYLWNHKDKYQDLLYYIGESFPNEYYKKFVDGVTIQQKPGYVGEALNVDAIVYEAQPYLVALYTAGLGGSTPASEEVNGVGIYQLGQICYVINEWHRVNQNP
nr:serine hydrolase [Streptococcus massiliensis]